MASEVERRIEELGFVLPECPKPVAAYVPATEISGFVFASGQTPIVNGELICIGKLGEDVDIEQGYRAASICALSCLAAIKHLIGDLDKVDRIVKLTGFVNSASRFGSQPLVINGASELIVKVFGERGKHARAAIGVAALPDNAAVEVEMIVHIAN